MLQVKTFPFNEIRVNTLVVYDDTLECAIIDPACYTERERQTLITFIEQHNLKPKFIITTHPHIDHILGIAAICKHFNLPWTMHKDGLPLVENAQKHALAFNWNYDDSVKPSNFIKEGDSITIGNSTLKVLYTPGHADGSICLVAKQEQFVIVGDVLFQGSIGRTDLPTGNYQTLSHNIYHKLFVLADEFLVYTGHGPTTTIGYERQNNPCL